MDIDRRHVLLGLLLGSIAGCGSGREQRPFATQLNWLHDPTFVAHYRLAAASDRYRNLEGGPNIFPLQNLIAGTADAAICGFDIFAKYLTDGRQGNSTGLRAIFCDFQRNPVGWVLHPEAAARVGVNVSAFNSGDVRARDALLEAIRTRRLRVGDKVGTETTAILRAWLHRLNLAEEARVIPVGFDSSLVESAPPLLFPVYLNEEPFRLEQRLGRDLLKVDPVRDGVALYGNVVVTRTSEPRRDQLRSDLTGAWLWARDHQPDAANLVARYYRSVPIEIVRRQVAKTIEFAFHETQQVGVFDLTEGGRLEQSISILKAASAIPASVTLDQLQPAFDAG